MSYKLIDIFLISIFPIMVAGKNGAAKAEIGCEDN